MTFLPNPHRIRGFPSNNPMLDRDAGRAVTELLAKIFDYEPTPLVCLPATAKSNGLASLHVKDEGARLGLKSFKALGGAYAVIRLVLQAASRQLGRDVAVTELPRPATGSLALPSGTAQDQRGNAEVARIAAGMTFACATDGNHGQSVAAGARLVGARAVIFVHQGVSAERRQAIARFGAEMKVVSGTYDDAVAESIRQCELNGWTLLSDTSWCGYTDVPKWVMQGYTAMVHEVSWQLEAPPTHVFLQAGVGGFAAAVATSLASVYEHAPPQVVIVEPSRAACLLASAQAGHGVKVDAGKPTLMSMLECYEPSLVAWDLLKPLTAAFMTIDEEDAVAAMQVLAHPMADAEVVVAGESGGAGLAGLLAACRDPVAKAALELGPTARVLLINTEGATDEMGYEAAVGAAPARVAVRVAAAR